MTHNLYRKNLRQWEQWSRVVVGVIVTIAALAASTVPAQIVLGLIGVTMIVTGIVGWCPACAAVGRRLESK